MWGFRRYAFRRGSRRTGTNEKMAPPVPQAHHPDKESRVSGTKPREDFALHMSNYTGETVIIYVEAGGLLGKGLTGVLLDVDKCLVRLQIRAGSVPSRRNLFTPGTVVHIPMDKIVGFAHPSL